MAPQPALNAADIERVRNLLQKGLSYRAIGAELALDKNTVAKFVRRWLPEFAAQRDGNFNAAQCEHPLPGNPMKLLVIDIETQPNLAYVWGVWNQNIAPSQLVTEKEIISFAAKWLGDDEVIFRSTYHDGKLPMVHSAHALMDKADGVITYNGAKFDVKHLNREFLQAGMWPPSPYKSIDLLQTVRRKFEFTSRKLDNVADKMGIGRKVEHEGFALWLKCMKDDATAWAKMREYNIHDVRMTEKLYHELLPWIEHHPSVAVMLEAEEGANCVNCGSEDLMFKGYYYTSSRRYNQFQCQNCGKWQRGTHSIGKTETTGVAG